MDRPIDSQDEGSARRLPAFRRLGEPRPRPGSPAPGPVVAGNGRRFPPAGPEIRIRDMRGREPARATEPAGAETAPATEPADGTVDRLTAEAAHDFNNILSVILSCATELGAMELDPEQRERVTEIAEAARRGAGLTRGLIDTARSGSSTPPPEPVDVAAAIGAGRSLLERTAGRAVEVEIELAPRLPRASCGAGQIEKLLLNLATNARDAMPAGGRLRIRAERASVGTGDPLLAPGWYARIAVTDTGVGMSARQLRRAPEPYFSTKRDNGSGLGLATVFGIARSSGGDVRITSAPGLGTTVHVYLPAVRPNGDRLSAG